VQKIARVCEPPPQAVSHWPNGPVVHPYVAHACVLQLCEVVGFGVVHSVSETVAPVLSTHVTLRIWVPPPHVRLQAENALVLHENVAHACVLQLCEVVGFGVVHSVSETVAPVLSTHVTLRTWVPPPHVRLQAENALVFHENVAHACVLQLCEVVGFGVVHWVSATAMPVASLMHVTLRIWVPPPHVRLQAENALASHENVQACGLQLCEVGGFADEARQNESATTPPGVAVHTTVRVCVPPPHAALQAEYVPAVHA
jgi:hypothetical protein